MTKPLLIDHTVNFLGFLISIKWGMELWYITQLSGIRQYQIFDVSILENTDGSTLYALKVVILALEIAIAKI